MSELPELKVSPIRREDGTPRGKDLVLRLHDGDMRQFQGCLQIVCSVGIGALCVNGLVVGGLHLTAAVGLVAVVAGCVIWLVYAVRQLLKKDRSIRCGPDALSIERGAAVERVFPYEQINSVGFQSESGSAWLRIGLQSGEYFCLPFNSAYMRRDKAEQTLLRAIGPSLRWDTLLVRSPRPKGILEGLEYDYMYNIPLVTMDAGVTYKYSYPSEISEKLGSDLKEILNFSWSFVLFYFLLSFSLTLQIPFTVLSLWAFTSSFGSRIVFRRALNDRFKLEGEGLRVFRGNKSWVIQLETPRSLFMDKVEYCDGGAKRYGHGRRVYFLDARFIEPDV